ncbi:hypothetical protein Q5P01_019103 [Channa striata]|uniref:Secreted protein n=1 Tax=Channa striata TaxID=64152 RepID=A0AA88M0P1_CHASR|nr:hypothetical protein Q5P01_019103 [Channa striata]
MNSLLFVSLRPFYFLCEICRLARAAEGSGSLGFYSSRCNTTAAGNHSPRVNRTPDPSTNTRMQDYHIVQLHNVHV